MLDIKTKCCLLCGVELTNGNQYATMLFHKSYRCIDCHKKEMGVSNKGRMYVNGKYVSREHPLYKPGRYKLVR